MGALKICFIILYVFIAANAKVQYNHAKNCSGDWFKISSKKVCEDGAEELKFSWFPNLTNKDDFPPGCSFANSTQNKNMQNKVIYNKNTHQSLSQQHPNYEELCSSGNFNKMNYGEFCSGIWNHITSAEDCEKAATELGFTWGGQKSIKDFELSPCFHVKDATSTWWYFREWTFFHKRDRVFFNPNAKLILSPNRDLLSAVCALDSQDCITGYSSEVRANLPKIKTLEKITKEECGNECDITKDCDSFDYLNEFPAPSKTDNCILYKKGNSTKKTTGQDYNDWVFCRKVIAVAMSSSTHENDKKRFGAHLAIDENTQTFSQTSVESNPFLELTLPKKKMIHNVTLIMDQTESYHGQILIIDIDETKNDEEALSKPRVCGDFNTSEGWKEYHVQCPKPLPANKIKIMIKEDEGEYSLKINEVTYQSKSYKITDRMLQDEINYTTAFGLKIEGALAIFAIASVVALILYIRHIKKNSKMQHMLIERLRNENMEEGIVKFDPDIPMNNQIDRLSYSWKKYEIDESKFTIGSRIGDGQFGVVSAGTISDLYGPDTGDTKVAAKKVKNSLNEEQVDSIVDELKIMSNLGSHPNLVNLLGSSTSNSSSKICIFLDYCIFGDLKQMLVSNRANIIAKIKDPGESIEALFDSRNLLDWCYEVAKGMEYLESKLIMHGDLAARNILIDENYVAKIGDFGLSKQMHYQQNYRKVNRRMVPWAWMALEYLETGELNIKSDVWSFGIVLWEMYSLGSKPYGIESYEDVKKKLVKGYHLPAPEHMSELDERNLIYTQIMEPCWEISPYTRPNFESIVQNIENLLTTDEIEKYNQMERNFKDNQKNLSMARGENSTGNNEEKSKSEKRNHYSREPSASILSRDPGKYEGRSKRNHYSREPSASILNKDQGDYVSFSNQRGSQGYLPITREETNESDSGGYLPVTHLMKESIF